MPENWPNRREPRVRLIPKVRGPVPSHIHIINSSYRESLIRSITLTTMMPGKWPPLEISNRLTLNLRNGKMNLLNYINTTNRVLCRSSQTQSTHSNCLTQPEPLLAQRSAESSCRKVPTSIARWSITPYYSPR